MAEALLPALPRTGDESCVGAEPLALAIHLGEYRPEAWIVREGGVWWTLKLNRPLCKNMPAQFASRSLLLRAY